MEVFNNAVDSGTFTIDLTTTAKVNADLCSCSSFIRLELSYRAVGTATDENGDGTPDQCECAADLDSDGSVTGSDMAILLGDWGLIGSSADLDGDGFVDGADLTILLASWGACS